MSHRIVLTLTALLALTGCATTDTSTPAADAVTVNNCGTDVVFDTAPERVMLLESAPVTILEGIDAFDTVISRAGSFPEGYYSEELDAQVEAVPTLSEDIDASGHLLISQEEVIAQEPDLVLGLPDGISRASLGDAGINALIQELYCPDTAEAASFDTLYDEITRYGEIFRHEEQAATLIDELRERVDAVADSDVAQDARTAAVLYPTVGGGTLYAYGTGSMAQPQLDALGLENVFADNSDRVFEVQSEALIDADPDVIIVLYQGDEDGITKEVTSLPGADSISAITHDRLFTQLFNFTEPASPLVVTGLEQLAEELAESHN